jgi:hypothetical protein
VHDVPPLGYAVFEIVPGSPARDEPAEPGYRIEFDEDAGTIAQIYRRGMGRPLLESAPPFAFNQYVYESGGEHAKIRPAEVAIRRDPQSKTVAVSLPARLIDDKRGPVFRRIRTVTSGPGAPSIEQSYTTYSALDRIDVTNRVEKVATRDPEGIYFAFPFDLRSPQCRLEIPFAAMRPGVDQLAHSAADFYSIYHWVECSDRGGGVLWAALEPPLVVFNELWPESWHDETHIVNGRVFSYVMNNRWYTNYRPEQGGELVFRYAIAAYDTAPDTVRAFRFGHETATPFLSEVVRGSPGEMPPRRSWFEVEPDHVMLVALKRSDDGPGWIVRLLELGVGECVARLTLPAGHWVASISDPVERKQRPLELAAEDERTVLRIPMRAGQLATLRLKRRPARLHQ